MKSKEFVLSNCLFFTSNRLSNILRKKAEKIFSPLGIGVPYVYLLIIAAQYNGITQTDLGKKLDISPSTCTRFVDKLVNQGILKKVYKWKTAHISLTDKGRQTCKGIDECVNKFCESIFELIGEEQTKYLTKEIWNTCETLTKNKEKLK